VARRGCGGLGRRCARWRLLLGLVAGDRLSERCLSGGLARGRRDRRLRGRGRGRRRRRRRRRGRGLRQRYRWTALHRRSERRLRWLSFAGQWNPGGLRGRHRLRWNTGLGQRGEGGLVLGLSFLSTGSGGLIDRRRGSTPAHTLGLLVSLGLICGDQRERLGAALLLGLGRLLFFLLLCLSRGRADRPVDRRELEAVAGAGGNLLGGRRQVDRRGTGRWRRWCFGRLARLRRWWGSRGRERLERLKRWLFWLRNDRRDRSRGSRLRWSLCRRSHRRNGAGGRASPGLFRCRCCW
jgi:hypothetical protein